MKLQLTIKISMLFLADGEKFFVERLFLVPKRYCSLPKEYLIKVLRKNFNKNNWKIIAYKYGTANVKMPMFMMNFKELLGMEMSDNSEWYIDPLFDKNKMITLDRRADPMILVIGDPKRLNYRINYYIDLINRGYSKDEALSYIYG